MRKKKVSYEGEKREIGILSYSCYTIKYFFDKRYVWTSPSGKVWVPEEGG